MITEWLNSLTPEDYAESLTTSSVYYVIKGMKIRLADHFTPHPKDSDVQIICPINNSNIYVVTIKEGLQILGFSSLKKLKEFLTTYALIFKVKKTSEEMQKSKTSEDSIFNSKNRTSEEIWGQICEQLVNDCPKYRTFSKGQKKICKALFCSNASYMDCVQAINTVSNAKNFSLEVMKEYFEPYINSHLK